MKFSLQYWFFFKVVEKCDVLTMGQPYFKHYFLIVWLFNPILSSEKLQNFIIVLISSFVALKLFDVKVIKIFFYLYKKALTTQISICEAWSFYQLVTEKSCIILDNLSTFAWNEKNKI